MKKIISILIVSIMLFGISGQVYGEEDTDMYIYLDYGEEITEGLLTGDIVNSEFEVYDKADELIARVSTKEGEKKSQGILLKVPGAKIAKDKEYKIKLVSKANLIKSYVIMLKTEVKEDQWGKIKLEEYKNGEETHLLGSKEIPIGIKAILNETDLRYIKLEDKNGKGVANQVLGIGTDGSVVEKTTNKWGYIVINASEETVAVDYSKANYNTGQDIDLITLSENELTATVIVVESKGAVAVADEKGTGTLYVETKVKGNTEVSEDWLDYTIKLTKKGKVITELEVKGEEKITEELEAGYYGITVQSDNGSINTVKSVTVGEKEEVKITAEVKPKNILRVYTVKKGKKVRNDYQIVGLKSVDYRGGSTKDYGVVNGGVYTVKNKITDSIETVKITSGLNTVELQGEIASVITSEGGNIKPTGVEERKTLAAIWNIIKIVTVVGFILFLGILVTNKKEKEVK